MVSTTNDNASACVCRRHSHHIIAQPDYQGSAAVQSSFDLLLQGAPAVLKQSSTKWKLHKDKPEAIPPRRRHSAPQQDATPWLLEDQAGNVTHKGQLEGGITASNYFLLVKEKEVFTALPLTAWYNFKPPPRRVAMSLEEAEAEMEKKHNSHFSGTGRLSRAIAANEGTPLKALFMLQLHFAGTDMQPMHKPTNMHFHL